MTKCPYYSDIIGKASWCPKFTQDHGRVDNADCNATLKVACGRESANDAGDIELCHHIFKI